MDERPGPVGRYRYGTLLRVLINITRLATAVAVIDQDTSQLTGPEQRLYKDLFASYNHESRPVRNASHTVIVTFALGLNQLLDLDEKNQILTTSVWIYEEWNDEMLKWSPGDYDGQTALMIPANIIWLPDIFIFNTAGPNMNGFVNVNGSKVAVQHDGNVKWMVPLMVASACAVDVTYFPYDRQACQIKFGSWIYDIDQLDILTDSDRPDLEHYVVNSEYDLEKVALHRGVLDSSCCPGDGKHPMVSLEVMLRRKSLYYDYIVIAPTIMLCVMTLASFLLPCDRGEKMNIGLTVFLTLYVLQLRIADNVPDTNSTPILGVFMLVVMTFNCVSLIMATLVMNIKKLGDRSPCPDVPRWLFALCRHVLGRVVCTPYLWVGHSQGSAPEHAQRRNAARRRRHGHEDNASARSSRKDESSSQVSSTSFSTSTKEQAGGRNDLALQGNQHHGQNDNATRTGSANESHETKGFDDMMARKGEDLPNTHGQQILCKTATRKENSKPATADANDHRGAQLRYRRQHHSSAQQNSQEPPQYWRLYDRNSQQDKGFTHTRAEGFLMKKRWFYVAEVVDKFLFLIYLVLLTCAIFTVLYLIPVYFRKDGDMGEYT